MKKKRRRKKKTMKENMMKMKCIYSSRNSIISSREEGLTREKEKRSQCQRGYAIIAVRMSISLPNAHMRGRRKTMTREISLTKTTKNKKYTKKKTYSQAQVDQEWNSSDESFESESDDLTTIVLKGKASSSKLLFPKLSKHTCLMAKEYRKKVKSNTASSLKYVTVDEDTLSIDNYDSSDDNKPLPSELVKNPNAVIKSLMRQVGARDEILEQQKNCLFKREKLAKNSRISQHLKR
jgi:hypothetical protein